MSPRAAQRDSAARARMSLERTARCAAPARFDAAPLLLRQMMLATMFCRQLLDFARCYAMLAASCAAMR